MEQAAEQDAVAERGRRRALGLGEAVEAGWADRLVGSHGDQPAQHGQRLGAVELIEARGCSCQGPPMADCDAVLPQSGNCLAAAVHYNRRDCG